MHSRPSFRRTVCAVCLVAVLALTGCSTPVGVRRLDTKEANRQLTESVLGGETLSAPTLQILNRAGLTEIYQDKPAVAIAALHRGAWAIDPPDRFFALAELSFLQALRSRDRSHYLASAVYAYAFLFPRDPAAAPGAFDPRLRTAVDVYNQGIAEGFTDRETNFVMLEAGRYTLPFGELVVRVDPAEYRWGPFRMVDFVAADHLAVRGLHNDYRWPGIGSALVAALKHVKGEREAAYTMVPSSLKMAATAFLKMDDVEAGIASGRVEGALALFTTQESTSVTVGGREVPLEFRPSSALAYTLEGSEVYSLELKALLSGDLALLKKSPRFKDNVFLMGPYRPGRIPLVLVHGTASSPARWAQLINEIINDRELWNRYQIWMYTYNTGNPVLYSAGILAKGLRSVVRELDPEGKDAALRKMVVVGHSQGGMLTKMTAVDSGTRFWDSSFTVPLQQLDISPEAREAAPAQPLLRAPAVCAPGRFHCHAPPRELPGGRPDRQPVAESDLAAVCHREPPERGGRPQPGSHGETRHGERGPSQHGQHEPEQRIRQIVFVDPHRAEHHRPLHHRRRQPGRPARGVERRRRQIQQRAHRRGRIRAHRALGPLDPGDLPDHRGGAADPVRESEDALTRLPVRDLKEPRTAP